MAVLGLMIIIIIFKKKEKSYCGAVPGTTILDTAVPRFAASSMGRSATATATILVFVWSARSGGTHK